MSKLPFSVFSYSSYLEFFQDSYEYLHQQDEKFSFDHIAEICDFKSRTLARSLIKGLQKPTITQLKKLSECFGLNEEAQEYVNCLLQFQAAQGSPAAFELFQKLARIQKSKLPDRDPFKEIEIATSVLHLTLLSALEIPNLPKSPAGIFKFLKSRYTQEQIEEAFSDLEQYHYIKITSAGIEVQQKHIKKYDLNQNFFLRKYHDECLSIAGTALHQEPQENRYLVGSSFAINQKVYPRIIQKINTFMENLMLLEGVAGPADTVVQVTTQLVKMTEKYAPTPS